MKKSPLHTSLCVCILVLATPIFANFTTADSAKAKQYCQGSFWGTTVLVENQIEASDKAIVEIAKRIKSAVEAQVNLSSSKNKAASGKIENTSSYFATSQISSNLTLSGFQSIESPKKIENGYEFKGYVCTKDIAKPYLDRQRALSDEMEISKDWHKIQSNWGEFTELQTMLEILRVESKYLAKAEKLYEKARDDYKANCSIKLHWKPQKKTAYSEIAYSKLSGGKMETSDCKGKDILLVYSGAEPECKSNGGPYGCYYQPSLRITSCKGEQLGGLLEIPEPIEGFGEKKEIALERLQNKLRKGSFWNEWEQKINQWSPQCEQ